MAYKILDDLETLLAEKDPTLLATLKEGAWSPWRIGLALHAHFPECPCELSDFKSGVTLKWLQGHYNENPS